jgi:tetratricopeptide (TPR) repeat protein
MDRYRVPALVAGWLLVILFAAATRIRLPIYAGDEAFWSAVTKADPLTAEAHLNLGNALAQRGDFAGAERAYRTALALPLRESDRPLALSALGAALEMSGRSVEAEAIFRQAASLTRAGPTELYSAGLFFYKRADARSQSGDRAGSMRDALESIGYLERAIRRDPRFAEAWLILGNCEALAGKREEARSAWRRVLELGGPKGPFAQEAREALSALR